ncbi:hypothetical protein [Flagellimonas onchidii]|uniref:hypothetical protein n=1 Tax=Flagellimonas onchidii TaxID=2562684 RepID=UPI0010A5E49D|nr:hypothetical protein [Allomuricauda onchidii]
MKKNKLTPLIVIISFLHISHDINGQSKIYFDKDWKVTTKDEAEFYRLVDKKSDSLFCIKDFYINGVLQMKGCFSDLDKETFEGEIVWYNVKGIITNRANYRRGQLHGLCTVYLENGEIDFTAKYINGKIYDGVYVGTRYKQFYKKGKLIKQVELEAVNHFRSLETRIFGLKKDTVYWMTNDGKQQIGVGIYDGVNNKIIDGLDIQNNFLIAVHTYYKNSKREGIQKVFYEGNLLTEQTFANDVVILERSINPLTGKTVEINFRNGKPYNGRLFQFNQIYEYYDEFIYKEGVVLIKNRYELVDGKLKLNTTKSYKKNTM